MGLKGTVFAKAQCGTVRLKLMKIGALLRSSVRRGSRMAKPTPGAFACRGILRLSSGKDP